MALFLHAVYQFSHIHYNNMNERLYDIATENRIQASLVIRDLTLRVFAITRFRGKKAVRKLYSNFAVTVYGGSVTVWRSHQLVTSYQYQCEREC